MKIVIAPDSFKESLSALDVANAIESGFKTVFPDAEYCKVPMADGGEGTVQAMVDATDGKIIHLSVTGPLGTKVDAFYGILGNDVISDSTAVIEMAAASGLHHVPLDERNPLITTTYGTGELIADALERGVKRIILGLGGSATNDAGAGMLQALGANLLDESGQQLPFGGEALKKLHRIDLSNLNQRLSHCIIDTACDVDNTLCGSNGASQIFGPQKGANTTMIAILDEALAHFANITTKTLPHLATYALELRPGTGAAGGMGYGVAAYFRSSLKPGVKIVTETVGLAQTFEGASLVITGEGRIDGQTIFGKTPMGVLNVATSVGVPTIAISGCLGDNAEAICDKGMKAIFPILPSLSSLDVVLEHAEENIIRTAKQIAATLQISL